VLVTAGENADVRDARKVTCIEAPDHPAADHADPLDRHHENLTR
jgi:hypothetical protein